MAVRKSVQRKTDSSSEITFTRDIAQTNTPESGQQNMAQTALIGSSESLVTTGSEQASETNPREHPTPKFGYQFGNLKIHAGGQSENNFSSNNLQLQRDPLPAVPNYQLAVPSLLQTPDSTSRYHLGGDMTLHLDPALQASIQQHTQRSFDFSAISSGIAGLGRGLPAVATPASPSSTAAPAAATAPTPGSAPGTTPATTPATPSSSGGSSPAAPGATPDLPRPGSAGDILSAIAAYPSIAQMLERLKQQAVDQALRDWNRLNTGERVLVVSSGIVIAAPALGFSLADPSSRAAIGSVLNGTPLPVPGVDWLHLETNLQADSFMVGFHLDLGNLLAPILPGFGPGSPTAIGDPPQPIQREQQTNQTASTPDIGSRIQAQLGTGTALEAQTQAQFSSSLGHDFSQVKIHHDNEADNLAKSVQARAFTTGADIFFRQGAYSPDTSDGQKLLAHELTHTVQQARGAVSGTPTEGGVSISDPSDSFEQEATTTAEKLMLGEPVQTQARASSSAIQREVMVQRDNTPAPAPTASPPNPPAPTTTPIVHNINSGMFDVSGAQPTLNGVVSAHPKSGSQVSIDSPNITFNATATLHSDVQMDTDEIIKVGPTQTLLGSSRVGVYRRGGLPNGEVIAEDKSQVGQVRDAQWQPNADGTVRADVEAPWYSRPSNITDKSRTATVNYLDKPGFELPTAVGEGRLTETRGSESFITALSAKRAGQVVHLSSSHWEVPWALTIDASHSAQGSAVTGGSSDIAPPTLDGPIAVQAAQDWLAFSSVEAAMTASNRVLLDHLLAAKTGNADAYNNIVQALRRKNPTVSIQITVGSTDSWVGTDDLELVAQGSQRRTLGAVNDRGTRTETFQLCDLIDPLAITSSTHLEFQLFNRNTFAPSAPATMSWVVPFTTASGTMVNGGGGGRYTLAGSIT